MFILLIDHFPNCTHLSPCLSCKATSFLKNKLNDDDFQQLISLLRIESEGSIALDASIHELIELDRRSRNCLIAQNIYTVGDVLRLSESNLMRIPNFGRGSLRVLRETLEKKGRQIGELEGNI